MILIQDQKPESESIYPDDPNPTTVNAGDQPPAYDAVQIRDSAAHAQANLNQCASLSTLPGSVEGPSLNATDIQLPILDNDKSSPHHSSLENSPSSSRNPRAVSSRRPRARKAISWLSLLPFASTFAARRVRQSISSIVSELVVPTSRINKEQRPRSAFEILSSLAEECTENKLSLSTILQETFIACHTPMYWAVVNYRQELLVALLIYSRPLSIQTISDIRRACLASSNQALFHALRVCRPPFHRTDGIQIPSLRAASNNLLLNNRPSDEIHILQTNDRGFIISFDISLWKRRLKVIGQVSIEFIASGRMWSVTFFSAEPSMAMAVSGKSRQAMNAWHVMINLLESSPPTFFDSQLVVDVRPTSVSPSLSNPRPREALSTTFPSSRDNQNRQTVYDYTCDVKEQFHSPPTPVTSEPDKCSSSCLRKRPPPNLRRPTTPPKVSTREPLPIIIRLCCGKRQLGRRIGGESYEFIETPTTKPDTWSDQGIGYTNAVVSPLGDGLASELLYDHSRYLLPDGTLRGRLEAKFVKVETSKDCVIC